MKVLTLDDFSGATFSSCGKYRYKLWRMWMPNGPTAMFIMLNPSTAGGSANDATIRRCIRFAQMWGYGTLYVCNLFAYRSTTPTNLLSVDDPTGPANAGTIDTVAKMAERIIIAWGNPPKPLVKRARLLSNWLRETKYTCYCLGTTNDGHPRHPLYVAYEEPLQEWKGYKPQKKFAAA